MTKKKSSTVRKSEQNAKSGLSRRALLGRVLAGLVFLGGLLILSQPDNMSMLVERIDPANQRSSGFDTHGGLQNGEAELADLFTPEVLYWEDDLRRWGAERGFNPNLLATLMQIESCGHPYVSSHAGAQGLFQVMPLHFSEGENQINPEQNAQSGIDHLQDCLNWSDYDVGKAMGCYNAGPWVIYEPLSNWPQETRNYYDWGLAIYNDAAQGAENSPTLDFWLGAGGSLLCDRARQTQQNVMPFVVTQP